MPPSAETDDLGNFSLPRVSSRDGLSAEEAKRMHAIEADIAGRGSTILVVDDNKNMRAVTAMTLQNLGYSNILEAGDGEEALLLLRQKPFDLVVLDLEMPKLDGFGVLVIMKDEPGLRDVPVIIASGMDDLDAMVRCIELGADDFLPKPVKTPILKARVSSLLERKRLRDLEQLHMRELVHQKQMVKVEREKSQRLLLNILPASIAERLKKGERTIAEQYDNVTVLFADLADFSPFVKETKPDVVLAVLNDLFSRFDRLANDIGLEKIKTVGDGYLVVGGMPEARDDHAAAIAKMSLGMLEALQDLNKERGTNLRMRIGIHSGPVLAGVIGKKKFAYDLWGATVNLASRMQSTGVADRVHVSATTRALLGDKFTLTARGSVECKGVGVVETFLLEGRK